MNKPLRVLIIRNAYQQDAGGAEQHALNLAIALQRAGHKPFLVTKIREILDKAKDQDIKTIDGKWHEAQGWYRGYYLRYPLTVLWYMFLILRHRIDVVHPQSRDDFVFATRAASLLGKKVIWTDHADLKHVLDNVNHFNPRMRLWVTRAAQKASAIICVSSSELAAISSVAPDLPKPVVIHNGVFPPQNITPATKTNTLVVGTNARLVPDKGIAELIEGFANLKDKKVDLWLLGGESSNQKKYSQLANSLGVLDQVKILGYKSDPNSYVAAMDVFVHPSYHEGLSLAIIEAAMLARPIIATRVGGTPEIIDGSCALLIEPRKASEITRTLHKLLYNKSLQQKLGSAAEKRARQHFDFQQITERQILPLYGVQK